MLRFLPSSLRHQLLLLLMLGVSLLSIFCIPLWHAWSSEIEAGRADLLRADARRMAQILAERGPAALITVINDRVGTKLDNTRQAILLIGPDAKPVAGNLGFIPAHGTPGAHTKMELARAGGPITLELLQTDLPGRYILWVGRDITRFVRLEAIFVRGMVGSALIALLAAGLATAAAQRSMDTRIGRIRSAAAEIMDGNLARRLPLCGSGHDFDLLATTVNRMLDQLEHLVANVRQSSNAIAHDLRTPLAELRSHLEHLTVTRPSYDELQDGLDVAIGDVDRVIGIFNAILRLAEIDSGTRRAGFRVFNACAVAAQAAELYEPVAEEHGVTLAQQLAGDLLVRGDPVLLAQALSNLIDNAIKYAPGGGSARIAIECQRTLDGCVEVVVADNGPGIAAADRDHAAQPFFRADWSRASPGVGLGLTLVAAVARLHDGTLTLADNMPGLRAVLRFPSV
jgi:signal transduction histidine kinase